MQKFYNFTQELKKILVSIVKKYINYQMLKEKSFYSINSG
jgi:hypothetical protein